jgi:2-methylcitrate dehydratase PrpD
MSGETIRLAQFASRLRFEDLPAPAIQRAKDSIADTIATIVFGRSLPWSAMIVAYARRVGDGGRSHILGDGERPVVAPYAALANGRWLTRSSSTALYGPAPAHIRAPRFRRLRSPPRRSAG